MSEREQGPGGSNEGQHLPIEQTRMFLRFQSIGDWCWTAAKTMDPFPRNTVGDQLVRAIDSVGANLVEGNARYGDKDCLRFFAMGVASAREAHYWLDLAIRRELVPAEEASLQTGQLELAIKELYKLIQYRRTRMASGTVRECNSEYGGPQPPTPNP